MVEYKQEIENMRKASFKAKSFDKAKFERRNKSANSDTSSKKDMRQHRIMPVPFNLKTDSRGKEKQKNTKGSQQVEASFKAKAMPNYKFFEIKHAESQEKKQSSFAEFDLKTRGRSIKRQGSERATWSEEKHQI